VKRYLQTWTGLIVALVALAAGVNYVVDPYGAHRAFVWEGFNARKPDAGTYGPLVKARGIERVRPRGLVLGNSRAEVGFDPEHQAWPAEARPVYNAALPGKGTHASLRYLQHALVAGDLRVVVVGLDLMDFLVPPSAVAAGREEGEVVARLTAGPGDPAGGTLTVQRLRDLGSTLLSLDALVSSGRAILASRDPYSRDLTTLGFNPMHEYERMAAREGYQALFAQRDTENLKAYQRRPKNLFVTGSSSSPPLHDLRRILDLARQAGVRTELIIYPYHANLLETFGETGLWPTFEQWKRAVVDLTEDARGRGADVRLWDFSGYNPVTTEPVPRRGDRSTRMRWYWEAGHFKRELGDRVLAEAFARPDGLQGGRAGLGVRLDRGNIDAHLTEVRRSRMAYLAGDQALAERGRRLPLLLPEAPSAEATSGAAQGSAGPVWPSP